MILTNRKVILKMYSRSRWICCFRLRNMVLAHWVQGVLASPHFSPKCSIAPIHLPDFEMTQIIEI